MFATPQNNAMQQQMQRQRMYGQSQHGGNVPQTAQYKLSEEQQQMAYRMQRNNLNQSQQTLPMRQIGDQSNRSSFSAGAPYRNQPMPPMDNASMERPTVPADGSAGLPDRTEEYLDGDEFDRYSVGDLALIRYKMSHEYVADIFSPSTIGLTSRPKSLYDVKNPSAFLAKQRKKAHEIERQMTLSMQQHAARIKQAKEGFAQWHALFKMDDPTKAEGAYLELLKSRSGVAHKVQSRQRLVPTLTRTDLPEEPEAVYYPAMKKHKRGEAQEAEQEPTSNQEESTEAEKEDAADTQAGDEAEKSQEEAAVEQEGSSAQASQGEEETQE